jgi:hypothetical protein
MDLIIGFKITLTKNNIMKTQSINNKNYIECDIIISRLSHYLQDNQYIYITSNEEIKKGDWYIWLDNKQICQSPVDDEMIYILNNHIKNNHIKKIVATNDDLIINSYKPQFTIDKSIFDFKVPKITQQSTEELIEYYNKNNTFNKVLVEIENDYEEPQGDFIKIKLNDKNEITMVDFSKPNNMFYKWSDKNYTGKEVIQLLENMFYYGAECQRKGNTQIEFCDDWIEKNLD